MLDGQLAGHMGWVREGDMPEAEAIGFCLILQLVYLINF